MQQVTCPKCGGDKVTALWKIILGASVFGFFFSFLLIWIPVIGLLLTLSTFGGIVWGIALAIFKRKVYVCSTCTTDKRFVIA